MIIKSHKTAYLRNKAREIDKKLEECIGKKPPGA